MLYLLSNQIHPVLRTLAFAGPAMHIIVCLSGCLERERILESAECGIPTEKLKMFPARDFPP